MIILILIICIAVLIFGIWAYDSIDELIGGLVGFIGGAGAVISSIALILLMISVSNDKVIDQKIEMYQAENTRIENQVMECVKQYQEYETEIFTEVKPESAVTLVSLYPELKADVLVSKQIEIYIDNNEHIKALKKDKINGNIYRWWLYFGGNNKDG